MAQSRIEAILENILGANNTILPPFSRNEVLLIQIMDMLEGTPGTPITAAEITDIVDSIS